MLEVKISMPNYASTVSLARAIKKGGGMEHPEHPGLFSDESWTGVESSPDGFSHYVACIFRAPEQSKPTIPELIEKWHANRSDDNRTTLWAAIVKADPNRKVYYQDHAYIARMDSDCGILVY